jgi:hypothetical protein
VTVVALSIFGRCPNAALMPAPIEPICESACGKDRDIGTPDPTNPRAKACPPPKDALSDTHMTVVAVVAHVDERDNTRG